MGLIEVLIFPIYILVFYSLVKKRIRGMEDPVLGKYYQWGFMARVASCMLYTFFLVFLSPGDSFGIYFTEAHHIFTQILKDPSTIEKMIFTSAQNIEPSLFSPDVGGAVVFNNENNYMVVRITSIVLFFSFGKYLLANFLFSQLAYEGCWRLFKFFYAQFPKLHKQYAIAILFFPTFLFWSSGISKEAICVAGIGFITYGVYRIFILKDQILASTASVLFFIYLLLNIKIYIFISYMPFLVYYIVFSRVRRFKSNLYKLILGPLIIVLALVGSILFIVASNEKLGVYNANTLGENIKTQQNNFETQENNSESNFSLGAEYDATIWGLIKISPMAITAGLARPFIWEARKATYLLSGFESVFLIYLTFFVLFKVGFVTFIRSIFQMPLITYCFLFAVFFSLFVGSSTLNFGSLVRYKIPCLPFYLIALYTILYLGKKKEQAIAAG
jgi:hypothetical protein